MTATNPGMFDRREYYKEKGVYYELRATTLQITSFRTNPVKDLLYRLRNRMGEVYTTSLPAKESGIVSAMILGDKSLLDIDIRQLYQESGIGHLLAISGHPHKELLQRLKNCHAGIFRTDQSGALTVTVKHRVTIRGYLDKTPSKLTRILFP